MTSNTKRNFLEDIFLKTDSIYTWHFNPEMELISSNCPAEEALKNIYMLSPCYDYVRHYVTENDKPICHYDDLFFQWIALPEYINQTLTGVSLIGPVCSSSTSDDFIKTKMNTLNMSVKFKMLMLDLLNCIPVIPNTFFCHYACQLYYTITGHKLSISEIQYQHRQNVPSPETLQVSSQKEFLLHNSYHYENIFLKNVEEGNINYTPSRHEFVQCGPMCPGDPLRQGKDEMIVYTALVTRAAIRGGYPAESAYACSDYYIQAIEFSETIADVYQAGATMYDDFIHRVYNAKQRTITSAFVRKCADYIDNHLTEKIDLDLLARTLGYSKYYLTRRFKEENNISLSQYIRIQRIDYAKLLLTDTGLNILEISEKLQFASPSHFTSVFRELTGVTPKEYRDKM